MHCRIVLVLKILSDELLLTLNQLGFTVAAAAVPGARGEYMAGQAGGGRVRVGFCHSSGKQHQAAKGGTGVPDPARNARRSRWSGQRSRERRHLWAERGGGAEISVTHECGGVGGGGGCFGGAGGSTCDGGSSGGGGGSGFVHPTATEPALESAKVFAGAANGSLGCYTPHQQGSGGAYSQLHRDRAGEPFNNFDGM
jgi:hypothetical protein